MEFRTGITIENLSPNFSDHNCLFNSLLSSSPLNLEPLVSASSSRDTESKLRSNSDSSSGFSEEEEDDGLYEEDEEESKSCDDEEISCDSNEMFVNS